MYLAVDEDGTETAFTEKPFVPECLFINELKTWDTNSKFIPLPAGSIKRMTGNQLTFEMGFVEYHGEIF